MIAAILIFLLVAVFALILGLIVYARWHYGVLEKSGIPVVKPTLFLGSIPDLHKKVHAEEDIRLFKEFGPNWALYEGREPVIFICDPELAKLIFVKDCDYFYDRRVSHFHDSRVDDMLDYLPGEKWKKLRRLETTLYSYGMVKRYNPQLVETAQDHIELLKNQCVDGRVSLDIRDVMDMVCLDGLFRVSFRVKLANFDHFDNKFFQSLKLALGNGYDYSWIYSLSMSFPFLTKFAPTYLVDDVIFETFRAIVNGRRQEKKAKKLEDPSLGDEKFTDLADLLAYCSEQLDTPEYKELGITETTLLAQALNIAALDMVSASQTVMAYHLAANPRIQETLYSEIERVIDGKHKGRIDNETVNEIPYLTACVNEVLRIAPPIVRSERCCNKDWTSPDGSVRIQKGVTVMTPFWAAFRNPEYFADPDTFMPERFLADKTDETSHVKNPYIYNPFGLGPRTCIGINLALETLKINTCMLVRNFQFSLNQNSRLQLRPGSLYLLQFYPVNLTVELRN